jgi:exonuclease SbcC
MRPSERFASLGPLLGNEFYKKLQEDLESAGSKAKTLRETCAQEVHDATQQVLGAIGELAAEGELEECLAIIGDGTQSSPDRIVAAGVLRSWLTQSLKHQALACSDAKEKSGSALVNANRAQEYLTATAAVADLLRERNERVLELREQVDTYSRVQALEALAGAQQLIGRLEPLVERERQHDDRDLQHSMLEEAIVVAQKELAGLEAEDSKTPAEKTRLEQTLVAVTALAATVAQRENDVVALELKAESAKTLTSLEVIAVEQEDLMKSAKLQSTQADELLQDARVALDARLLQQLHERAAVLASMLEVDEACPVCGSVDHPHLAQSEFDLVSDEEIELIRQKLDQLSEDVVARSNELAQISELFRVTQLDVAQVRGSIMGLAREEIAEELNKSKLAQAAAQSASAQVFELENELTALVEREQDFEHARQEAIQVLTQVTAELALFEKVAQAQQESDQLVLGSAQSALDLDDVTRSRISSLEAFLAIDEEFARGQIAIPDLGAVPEASGQAAQGLETWLVEVQEVSHRALLELEVSEALVGRLEHASKAVQAPSAKFENALKEQERVLASTSHAIDLSDAVSASKSSINSRRMTLQSYAVQRRFESVLNAASIHLFRMSAGKYSLVLDEDAKGNAQAGLGIKVNDAWSGQTRDPRSLSGGETFYTALSLALGLADVVRDETGGSQLETLFVDEGFGSLDQESLQLVLEQLDALRSGGRIVGVVSHVTEMKEWVQDRIEVQVAPDRTSRVLSLV